MAITYPTIRGERKRRTRYQNGWALAFLAPWLVGFLAFTAGPMLMSLYLAFTDYDLLSAPKWIGAGNFSRMFGSDPLFLQSLKVTAIYVFVGTPLSLTFALAVAVVLNRGLRGLDFYRSAIYLPSLFGGSVAIAVLWRKVFNGDGLVNQMLALVGIHGPSWISEPHTALGTLIALEVWQFGAPMVIFIAGLKQIPAELYEAASLDGAKPWRQFSSITFPLISAFFTINVVLSLKGFLQVFDPVVALTNGGPGTSTESVTLLIFRGGFTGGEFAYQTANAVVFFIVITIVSLFQFRVLQRREADF